MNALTVSGLKPRWELFCREYVIDFDVERAARAAGFAKSSAYACGNNILARADAMAFVGQLLADRFKKVDLTAEHVLRRYKQMLDADRRNLVDETGRLKGLHEIDEDLAACIDGFEITDKGIKFKLVSRRAVARDVGEMFALFKTITESKTTLQVQTIDPAKLSDQALRELMEARQIYDAAGPEAIAG